MIVPLLINFTHVFVCPQLLLLSDRKAKQILVTLVLWSHVPNFSYFSIVVPCS